MKAPIPYKFLCCFCVVFSLGFITRLLWLGRRDTIPFDVHKIRVFSLRGRLIKKQKCSKNTTKTIAKHENFNKKNVAKCYNFSL